MPTYSYRCAFCGDFNQMLPMADANAAVTCQCGETARRVFGFAALRSLDPAVRSALDVSAASADTPQLVPSVPGRSRRATRITEDPRHKRLPRP